MGRVVPTVRGPTSPQGYSSLWLERLVPPRVSRWIPSSTPPSIKTLCQSKVQSQSWMLLASLSWTLLSPNLIWGRIHVGVGGGRDLQSNGQGTAGVGWAEVVLGPRQRWPTPHHFPPTCTSLLSRRRRDRKYRRVQLWRSQNWTNC